MSHFLSRATRITSTLSPSDETALLGYALSAQPVRDFAAKVGVPDGLSTLGLFVCGLRCDAEELADHDRF
jgi:hypothetical protein